MEEKAKSGRHGFFPVPLTTVTVRVWLRQFFILRRPSRLKWQLFSYYLPTDSKITINCGILFQKQVFYFSQY